MNKSHISKITTVVLVALLLPFTAAAVDFDMSTVNISFDEDTTYTGLDLDNYATNVNGAVSYTYSGNDKITVNIDANNIVTFTPAANWNGNEQITFTADDTDPGTQNDIITVTVRPINDAPTLTLPASLNAIQGQAFSHQVVGADVDLTALTFSADALDWDTFSINANGLISFTPESIDVGIHEVKVTIKDTSSVEATKKTIVIVGEPEDSGALLGESIEVEDQTGDDSETLPGDDLKVTFDVSNEITTDMKDIKVRVWIQDSNGDRISDRIDTEKFDVDGKDTLAKEVELKVPVDAEDGVHYVVFEATGEDDDGNNIYDLQFAEINVERNSHDLLIESVTFNPEIPVCGGPVEVSVNVVNIGKSDEDDAVLTIKNTNLGIDFTSEVFNVEESGSDADHMIRAVFDLAKSTSEEFYPLDIKLTFDGTSGSESKIIDMQVSCDESVVADEVEISTASTFAAVAAGQTVKFVVEITNNGASAADFVLSATGVQDWATVTIEPGDISLDSDAQVPVNIYITPKSGASLGTHTATLTVESDGKVVATKDFTINVESSTPNLNNLVNGLDFSNSDTTAFLLIVVGIAIVAGFAMMSRSGIGRRKVDVYDDEVPRKRR
ncbi:MAG: putative S-layer protein [Nanoarchaeota archaeon]